jgi:hypothetical protein
MTCYVLSEFQLSNTRHLHCLSSAHVQLLYYRTYVLSDYSLSGCTIWGNEG